MQIITFGTEGRTGDELRTVLARRAVARIIDVRQTRPRGALGLDWPADRHGVIHDTLYVWVPELSVKTLRAALVRGEAPTFANLEAGTKALARYFASDPSWLFLGDADDPRHDARGHLAARYAEELGATVVHERADAVVVQGGLW